MERRCKMSPERNRIARVNTAYAMGYRENFRFALDTNPPYILELRHIIHPKSECGKEKVCFTAVDKAMVMSHN